MTSTRNPSPLTIPLTIALTISLTMPIVACSSDAEPDDGALAACDRPFPITEPNPDYLWTPSAIQLQAEQLAPGVFAVYDDNADEFAPAGVPLATSAGFVIGDDGVLLVETMINRQLLCQLHDLVRERTDKPILYAVNTSYHGDHSYGNTFLPDAVDIVQHERTAAYIGANFDEDLAFMEANFGTDQGLDELVPVAADILVSDAGWSVDLGGVTVDVRYHGFAQTEGDLFVSVPEAGIVWTGNAMVGEQPAVPWLLDGRAQDVGATLATVRDSLAPGAVIIPGHGRPIAADGFDFSIDYLTQLVVEVQAAVDGGLSVEDTVQAVVMEDFHGYAIWDWVHGVVNVPATHAELSQ